MPTRVTTVEQYLAALPPDRRAALAAVRETILANLGRGYAEGIQYGMIGYFVPHEIYPDGYHCDPRQPLPFACLASQKGHMSLHLMGLYMGVGGKDVLHRWFTEAWKASGRKLDMGKACVRFKKLDDVPLDVVGEAIRRMPAKDYIAAYEAARDSSASGRKARAAKQAPPKGSGRGAGTAAGRTGSAGKPARKAAAKAGSRKRATKRATKPATRSAAKRVTKGRTRSSTKGAKKPATASSSARR